MAELRDWFEDGHLSEGARAEVGAGADELRTSDAMAEQTHTDAALGGPAEAADGILDLSLERNLQIKCTELERYAPVEHLAHTILEGTFRSVGPSIDLELISDGRRRCLKAGAGKQCPQIWPPLLDFG